MSHDGVGLRAVMRSVAFLTAGVLAVPAAHRLQLREDEAGKPARRARTSPPPPATGRRRRHPALGRGRRARDPQHLPGGRRRDHHPDRRRPCCRRCTGSTRTGGPQLNADYLESAEGRRDRAQAGRPLQAQPAGRVERRPGDRRRRLRRPVARPVRQGLRVLDRPQRRLRPDREDRARAPNDLEVKVTFSRPYADWQSLFSPLYPKEVMGTPDAFNDGARRKLKVTAGPFALKKVDPRTTATSSSSATRAGGAHPAKLDQIVLHAVPRDKRADGAGRRASSTSPRSTRPTAAAHRSRPRAASGHRPAQGPGAGSPRAPPTAAPWARARRRRGGADEERRPAEAARGGRRVRRASSSRCSAFEVRKSLEPAYTQLALNGADGPLADERVRRAVARALDRKELAEARPQAARPARRSPSAAISRSPARPPTPTTAARSAARTPRRRRRCSRTPGWVPGGPVEKPRRRRREGAGGEGKKAGGEAARARRPRRRTPDVRRRDDGTPRPSRRGKSEDGDGREPRRGDDDKPYGEPRPARADQAPAQDGAPGRRAAARGQGGAPGAYAPKGTAAPGGRRGRGARQGRQAAHPALRAARRAPAPRRCAPSASGSPRMLDAGRCPHRDHQGRRRQLLQGPHRLRRLRPGPVLLARLRLPGHRRPARSTPSRCPPPTARCNVEQNYTRVGTDQVDQLFDQAVAELDEDAAARPGAQGRRPDLGGRRIHPALPAAPAGGRDARTSANAGAFGFADPPLPGHRLPEEGRRQTPRRASR